MYSIFHFFFNAVIKCLLTHDKRLDDKNYGKYKTEEKSQTKKNRGQPQNLCYNKLKNKIQNFWPDGEGLPQVSARVSAY